MQRETEQILTANNIAKAYMEGRELNIDEYIETYLDVYSVARAKFHERMTKHFHEFHNGDQPEVKASIDQKLKK